MVTRQMQASTYLISMARVSGSSSSNGTDHEGTKRKKSWTLDEEKAFWPLFLSLYRYTDQRAIVPNGDKEEVGQELPDIYGESKYN